MLKRVGESKQPCLTPTVVLNQSLTAVVMYSAGGLVVETLCRSDQVGVDVIQPHGGPECCVPHPVERFFLIHEDMVQVLMVLQFVLTQDPKVEDLLRCAAPRSKATLFLGDDLFRLWL